MISWNINLRDMTVERFDAFSNILAYVRKLADYDLLTNPETPLPEVK